MGASPRLHSRSDGVDDVGRWSDICERNPVRRRRQAAAQCLQRWWRCRCFIVAKKAEANAESSRKELLQIRERVEHRAARCIQIWFGFHLYRRRAPVPPLIEDRHCEKDSWNWTLCWCAVCLLKRLYKHQTEVAARRVQRWWRLRFEGCLTFENRMEHAVYVLSSGENLGDVTAATRTLVESMQQSPDRCINRLDMSIVADICGLIGGLPPAELLIQLLELLAHLTPYYCASMALNGSESQHEVNLDMMEALMDVLQLHRTDRQTVVLSAYALTHCVQILELEAKKNSDLQERFNTAKERLDRLVALYSLKLLDNIES